jgi:hypothetical protein
MSFSSAINWIASTSMNQLNFIMETCRKISPILFSIYLKNEFLKKIRRTLYDNLEMIIIIHSIKRYFDGDNFNFNFLKLKTGRFSAHNDSLKIKLKKMIFYCNLTINPFPPLYSRNFSNNTFFYISRTLSKPWV